MHIKTKRQTLMTFYFIFILFGLSVITVDPLIPVIAEQIQVGFDKIGIALFIGSIATLISNFIAGRLSDIMDIKKLVLFGLSLLLLGFALFGTYLNYIIFVMIIIFLRMGFGTIDTTLHSFSSKLFRKDTSRIFLNIDISWYAGASVGPLLISMVLYFNIEPRYLFFIIAFVYAVSAIIFYLICPKKKIQDNKSPLGENIIPSGKKGLTSIKDPTIIIGSLILFFYMGSIMGLSSWLTTYFLGFGIRVAYGSAILSLYWFFSILGIVIASRLLTRVKEITILFFGCLIGTLCLCIFSFIPNVFAKITVLTIQSIFFAGIFPLTTAISAQRDPENSGTILGFIIALAFAGSIVFQPIYGYVAEYFGKNYIVYVALAGALIGLVFTFILFRIFHQNNSDNI